MNEERFVRYLLAVKNDLVSFSETPSLGAVNGTPVFSLGTQVLAINSLFEEKIPFSREPERAAFELLENEGEKLRAFLERVEVLIRQRRRTAGREDGFFPATLEQLVENYEANKKAIGKAQEEREEIINLFDRQIEEYNREIKSRVERAVGEVFFDIEESKKREIAEKVAKKLLGIVVLSDEEIDKETIKRDLRKKGRETLKETIKELEETDSDYASLNLEERLEALGRKEKGVFIKTITSREAVETFKREKLLERERLYLELKKDESPAVDLYYDNIRAEVLLALSAFSLEYRAISEISEKTARRVMETPQRHRKKGGEGFKKVVEKELLRIFKEEGIGLTEDEYEEIKRKVLENTEASLVSFSNSEVSRLAGESEEGPGEKPLFRPLLASSSATFADAFSAKGGLISSFIGTAAADLAEDPIGWTLKGGPVLALVSLPLDALPSRVKLPLYLTVFKMQGMRNYYKWYFSEEVIGGKLLKVGVRAGSVEWERNMEAGRTMQERIGKIEKLMKTPLGVFFNFYYTWWKYTNYFEYLKMSVFRGTGAKSVFGKLGITYVQYLIKYGPSPMLTEYMMKAAFKGIAQYFLAKTKLFMITGPEGFQQFVFTPTYRLKERVKNVIYAKVWRPLKKSRVGKIIEALLEKKGFVFLKRLFGGALGLLSTVWDLRKPLGFLILGIILWAAKYGMAVAIGAGIGGIVGGFWLGIKLGGAGLAAGGPILGALGFVTGFIAGALGGGVAGGIVGYLLQSFGNWLKGIFGGGAGTGLPTGLGIGTGAELFTPAMANTGGLLAVGTVGGVGATALVTVWITSSAFIAPVGEKAVGESEYFELTKEASSEHMFKEGVLENKFLPEAIRYKISLKVKNKGAVSEVEIEDVLTIRQKGEDGKITSRELRRKEWNGENDERLNELLEGALWESEIYSFEAGEDFKDSLLTNTVYVRAKTEEGKEEKGQSTVTIKIGDSPLPETASLAELLARILISCPELSSYRVAREAGGVKINGVIINKENWITAEGCLVKGLRVSEYFDRAERIIGVLAEFRGSFEAMQCVHFARAATIGSLGARGSAKDYCNDVPPGYKLSRDWEEIEEGDLLVRGGKKDEAGHIAVVINKSPLLVAEALGTGAEVEGVVQYNRPVAKEVLKDYCGYLRKL